MLKHNQSRQVAIIAIFFAVMLVIHILSSIVFAFWPIPIKPTIITIPVIIASIVYGPKIGGILGGLMGLISIIHNTLIILPTSYLFSPFVDNGNGYSLIVALIPRILIGIFPYFCYKILHNRVGLALAGAIGSLTNTVFVLTGIFIFFAQAYNGDIKNLLTLIVLSNASVELLISALVTSIAVPRLLNQK